MIVRDAVVLLVWIALNFRGAAIQVVTLTMKIVSPVSAVLKRARATCVRANTFNAHRDTSATEIISGDKKPTETIVARSSPISATAFNAQRDTSATGRIRQEKPTETNVARRGNSPISATAFNARVVTSATDRIRQEKPTETNVARRSLFQLPMERKPSRTSKILVTRYGVCMSRRIFRANVLCCMCACGFCVPFMRIPQKDPTRSASLILIVVQQPRHPSATRILLGSSKDDEGRGILLTRRQTDTDTGRHKNITHTIYGDTSTHTHTLNSLTHTLTHSNTHIIHARTHTPLCSDRGAICTKPGKR